MNRAQFIALTVLSSLVALSMVAQLVLVHLSTTDENQLRLAGEELQAGQIDFGHLQQIAARTAQLAQQQNDQDLKDLLTRNNIQINNPPASNPEPAAPAGPAMPAAH